MIEKHQIFILHQETFTKGIKELCIPYCSMWNFLELQCLVDDLVEVDMGLQN